MHWQQEKPPAPKRRRDHEQYVASAASGELVAAMLKRGPCQIPGNSQVDELEVGLCPR